MNKPTSLQLLESAERCFVGVIINLLLSFGFTFLLRNFVWATIHIVCALCFAVLTVYYRHRHLEELKKERAYIQRTTGK